MKILLSIKPEYVEQIFLGEKKFEYRRSIFKNRNVDTIVIYATKPIGKVVGEFKIQEIIEDTPKEIWEKTFKYAGIDKEKYYKYFESKSKGFAIGIKNVKLYKNPLDLSDINPNIKHAPQSFVYIKEKYEQ